MKFAAVESLLRSLSPADVQMNREDLIYSAGVRTAKRRAQKIQRMWQASTAAAILLCAGLIGMLFVRPSVLSVQNETVLSAENETALSVENQVALSVEKDRAVPYGGEMGYGRPYGGEPGYGGEVTPPFEIDPTPLINPRLFSSIQNVDPWSREELEKRGISVKLSKQTLETEDPPADWVQVTFDASHLSDNQDALMTAWFVSDGGVTESAGRVATDEREKDTLRLLLAVGDGYRASSFVAILMWKGGADSGRKAYGYQLSMKRMIELATIAPQAN